MDREVDQQEVNQDKVQEDAGQSGNGDGSEKIEIKRGQDNAYMEFDVDNMPDLIKMIKADETKSIRHMTLKCGRVELSDSDHVDGFLKVARSVSERDENKDLDDAQLGFLIFGEIFEAGLIAIAKEI
jgi:hypothetical protein